MAPDLNSVPASPRHVTQIPSNPPSMSPSRRSSQQHHEQFPNMPVRHSRPMTPAELHHELEAEQEAVVNRLTRELSQLRAHSASVASNASSSSANTTAQSTANAPAINYPSMTSSVILDPNEPLQLAHGQHHVAPPSNLAQARHHRSSSSSLNARTRSLTSSSSSFAQPPTAASTAPATGGVPVGNTSQASLDRARDAVGLGAVSSTSPVAPSAIVPSRSRQNSNVYHPSSTAPSPELAAATVSTSQSGSRLSSHGASSTHASSAMAPPHTSAARLEDVSQARKDLEVARTENDRLIVRIKDLEREVRTLKAEKPAGETQPCEPDSQSATNIEHEAEKKKDA